MIDTSILKQYTWDYPKQQVNSWMPYHEAVLRDNIRDNVWRTREEMNPTEQSMVDSQQVESRGLWQQMRDSSNVVHLYGVTTANNPLTRERLEEVFGDLFYSRLSPIGADRARVDMPLYRMSDFGTPHMVETERGRYPRGLPFEGAIYKDTIEDTIEETIQVIDAKQAVEWMLS